MYLLSLSLVSQLELEMQEFKVLMAVVLLQREDMPLPQFSPERSCQQLLWDRVSGRLYQR